MSEWYSKHTKKDLADRIEELKGQLQSVLDRETSILRYYDAKLDAAEAKLLEQALAMPEIKALVEALKRSADGWHEVVGLGIIPEEHFGSAMDLRDKAIAALRDAGVAP